jgi:two-component system sensor histidine kinase QseC
MNTWQRLSARLGEPTLQRRSVASVLAAFAAVWIVLLGYIYWESRSITLAESGMRRFGDALADSIAPLDEREAVAALAATAHWVNVRRVQIGRFPGVIQFELLDAAGQRVWASEALRELKIESPATQLAETHLLGAVHRVYEGRRGRWTLRVIEPWRTDAQLLAYNGKFILPYLLVALPVVLLPVWLSVRNGLKPLSQLARAIAAREPGDLRPIAFEARHAELKPLVGSLNALLERVRGTVARERAFVHNAAHEIRTPLAVVAAQAHVVAHERDAEAAQRAQAQLQHAIGRTSHMAQQLLALASLEEKDAPAGEAVDVAARLREALARLAPAAIEKDVELSLDAPDRLHCPVDETALESIVHNLLDNALRYGSAGGRIAVTLRDDCERVTLLVQDNGAGIAPADQPQVFERFWRGAGHDAPGTGLGLAIVRQAAARLGGTVRLMQGLGGRGAGFRVSFPNGAFRPG